MSRLRWAVVVDRATVVVTGYDAVGGCILRQVYYRLVAEAVIPHTASAYRHLSARLAQARRQEGFPDLIDPLREVHVPPAWPDAGAFLQQAPAWFCLDHTAGQAAAVYVACEKDTLRAQLTGWLAETGIPVLVVRGFGSQSYAHVVKERTARDPGPAVLLYLGDFDSSGEDIERDWVARTGCWSRTERVLLTYEQVRAYELPATEGKRGDPRWPAFARRYGFDPRRPVQWEVEALESAELRRLVLAAVDPYIDRDALARQIAREGEQRRALAAFLDGWDAAGGGAPS
ncbi:MULTISPECIES: hypothetical protein [unclassified Streptomyces]|uniref:hypothetical protein n=1 Tax=unclassified Streptomyces TaxID=2593676 RepID=UPI00336AA147